MTRRESMMLFAGGVAEAQGEQRQVMPSFLGKSLDGATFNRETTMHKVVLIQHWATWCGYCRKDEPGVEAIIRDHAAQGLVVMAVNAGEQKAKVLEYLKEHKRSAKIVLASDTNLRRFFEDAGLPAYILIDRDGKIAHMQAGSGGLPAFHEMMRIVGLKK